MPIPELSDRMRILATVPCPQCYGLQNLTLQFFGKLPGAITCHFICTRWSDGEFAHRLDQLNIPHSATWFGMFSRKLDWVNLRMTLECLAKLPIAWSHCIRVWWSFRPDVIYVANHHEVILLWPLLLLMRQRVVCHMHDPPPPILFQRMSFWVWKRAVGRFLCISENVRRRLALLGEHAGPVVVHNGVEVFPLALPRTRSGRFTQQFGWSEDCVVVGITGQLNREKGHEDFLTAADAIRNRCPQARFVVGGKPTGVYFDELQGLIEKLGIRHLVGFSGWLPASRDFFEAIDVFVLASRHEEGFGLVVAEAGERGIPVVATKSGGAVEILVDGVSGLLVERQNPGELAASLTRLLQEPQLRAALGSAGRKRVEEAFDIQTQVGKFVRFLRRAG